MSDSVSNEKHEAYWAGPTIAKGRLISLASLDGIAKEIYAQGWASLGRVIEAHEAHALRDILGYVYSDPSIRRADAEHDILRNEISLMRAFEHHHGFRQLLDHKPIIKIVEHMLGEDCHVIAQNALRIRPGGGLVRWHIDDQLFFPFLSSAHIQSVAGLHIPCFVLSVMVMLTDVESLTYGPTEVIPESHLSGQYPEPNADLQGQSVAILAKAGEAYVFNSQLWHRGAPNQSCRTRYAVTTTYGRRFIAQRFYPFLNYKVPAHVLQGASSHQLRLLGMHQKGPYG